MMEQRLPWLVMLAALVFIPADAFAGEHLVSPYLYPLQTGPDVAQNSDGRFMIAWMSAKGQYQKLSDLSGRFFLTGGLPWHNEFQVNELPNNDQIDPQVAITETGKFGVVWTT